MIQNHTPGRSRVVRPASAMENKREGLRDGEREGMRRTWERQERESEKERGERREDRGERRSKLFSFCDYIHFRSGNYPRIPIKIVPTLPTVSSI